MKHQLSTARQLFARLGTVTILLLFYTVITLAQTTAFTYQGKLVDNGTPTSGNYDLTFKLYDTSTVGSGAQQGTTLSLTNVAVSGGVFTVQLDFGACGSCFNGAARYLEVSVKPSSGSTFTTLSPRQQLTATPYALKSVSAATADGLSVTCVSCVTSNQIQSVNGSAVSGAIPVASVPAGSTNYIQNTTTQQAASTFNISGDGTAGGTLSGNIVNATTQFNLGGQRLLAATGAGSFVNSNTFAGVGAGVSTTPDSGGNGIQNSFFGQNTGQANTTGGSNAFFGWSAGLSNTTGGGNVFFGRGAGANNTTGGDNAFFGRNAGQQQTTGTGNTFIGSVANYNTFNATGSYNTLLGSLTTVNSGLSNASAIGAYAAVTQNNSLVLGSIHGANFAPADTNVGIGTTAPAQRLHVVGNSAFVGNLGIGTTAPAFRLHVEDPGNSGVRVETNTQGGTVASFGGFGDFQIDANGLVGGRFIVKESGNVGIGTAAPNDKLEVNGIIRQTQFGAGGTNSLCRNSSNQISLCSSSRRYKENIADWHSGLNLLNRLRPVTFDWKESKMHDLGLVAEEVAEVEPLLVMHNDKGEIEGVKYDRIGVVLLNAVKEQQAQIDSLKEQQTRVEALQKENLDLKARLASLEQLMQQHFNPHNQKHQ